MNRITRKHLQPVVDRINRATNNPAEPWRQVDCPSAPRGKRTIANIGNYHLSQAYGGYSLHRMVSDGGGVSDVFRCGHVPARELYNRLHAFLDGLSAAGVTRA